MTKKELDHVLVKRQTMLLWEQQACREDNQNNSGKQQQNQPHEDLILSQIGQFILIPAQERQAPAVPLQPILAE